LATNIDIILSWFKTGKKPTQKQFSDSWTSFWHKDEQIPQSAISDLSNVLATKVEQSQFDAHQIDENAHAALLNLKEDKGNKSNDVADISSVSKFPVWKVITDWVIDYFSAAKIKTILGITTLAGSNTGDQDLNGLITIATDQNISGIKTFLAGKLGLRNTANTFSSFLTNANTASRTYLLQNRNGTLADDIDLASKMNNPKGTTNYLPKFSSVTTIGSSRLFDDGTFLGVGTINSPTKDITLGYQIDREIGIEESNNANKGKNLMISAGRTIDYAPAGFTPLNDIKRKYFGLVQIANGDILASGENSIYKQDTTTGHFNPIIVLSNSAKGMFVDSNNNLFVAVGSTIQKQTNSTGPFVAETSITPKIFTIIDIAPNGDSYAVRAFVDNGGAADYIYKRTGNIGDFIPVGTIIGRWNCISCSKINGWIYASQWGSGLYQSKDNGTSWQLIYSFPNISNVLVLPNGTIYISQVYGSTPNYMYSVNNGVTFLDSGVPVLNYNIMRSIQNGNVFTFSPNTTQNMYVQSNYAPGLPNLDGGTLKLKAGSGKGTGQSRLQFITGQKTISGTDMQLDTLRGYIDENGYIVWLNMPVYANNIAAISDGLPVGAEYRTATGERRMVY
jgi:hypothetical protein